MLSACVDHHHLIDEERLQQSHQCQRYAAAEAGGAAQAGSESRGRRLVFAALDRAALASGYRVLRILTQHGGAAAIPEDVAHHLLRIQG